MAKLVIAVANILTGQGNTNRTVDDALLTLKGFVEDVEKWCTANTSVLEHRNKFHAVFAAPEYFFIAQHAKDRLPLTPEEKDKVEVALLKLSKDHPKIVMAPGSIFYQEKMNREKVIEAQSNVLAAEFAARLRANPAAKGSQVKPSELFKSRGPQDKGLNIVAVKSIPDATERGKEMTKLELGDQTDPYWGKKHGLINVLTGLKTDAVRGRNRAYLLLGGEKIGMYDKHSDFYETGKAPDKYFFIPGTNEQCPVVGGFKFGMEICADHRLGVLKNRDVSALDFQIVLSDMVDRVPANICVQVGGFYIHSSSSPASTSVVARTATGLTEILNLPGSTTYTKTGRIEGVLVDIAHRS